MSEVSTTQPRASGFTQVTYVESSGLPVWKGVITGALGDRAIPNMDFVETVEVGNRVTRILTGAFQNFSALVSITIPSSVTEISNKAFDGVHPYLASITVDPGNTHYMSENNLLLSKDGGTVIRGVNGDVIIPDGVETINPYAFNHLLNLRSVTIPDTVTQIKRESFQICPSLTEVNITPNGGDAESVRGQMIDAGCPEGITWNLTVAFVWVAEKQETITVTYNAHITLGSFPDWTKTGNTLGWWDRPEDKDGGNQITESTAINVTRNLTYYARWTPNRYTVLLETNGGTIVQGNVTEYTYGTGAILPVNNGTVNRVVREGFIFDGWFTLPSGGTPVSSISATDIGNKTFYAYWTIIDNLTITWDGNGGTPSRERDENLTFDYRITSFPKAVRKSYIFQGWYTKPPETEDGEPPAGFEAEKINPPLEVKKSAEYQAHWTPVEYNIFYILRNKGKMPASAKTKYTVEDADYTPGSPEIIDTDEWDFAGWNPAKMNSGTSGDFTFVALWTEKQEEQVEPEPEEPDPLPDPEPTPIPIPDPVIVPATPQPVDTTTISPHIALCCVAKPGSENMHDWINHHLEMGFDRVYIYNDGTVDGFKKNVEDHPETYGADRVTVVDFPYNHEKDYRTSAYADCYRTNKDKYDWMAFIDSGEYIVLTGSDFIKDILQNKAYCDYECIRLNVVEFSDYLQMTRDFCLMSDDVVKGTYLKSTMKMAKSIVNCKAKGLLMGIYSPTRNGQALKQCLPNLEPVTDNSENPTKKGTNVNKIDVSLMYVTPNQLELRWRKWKKAKGY